MSVTRIFQSRDIFFTLSPRASVSLRLLCPRLIYLSPSANSVLFIRMNSILASLNRQFVSLDKRSRELLDKIDDAQLFVRVADTGSLSGASVGEYVLRSAAMVEKTFGGITTRLWDDPFEWTLPEKLSDKAAVVNYLDEVEATRKRGFAFFASDDDLSRQIPAPEKLTPIIDILLDALVKASHYQGRAAAIVLARM